MDPREHEAPADDHAVYGMAVASELTGVNPPMLRAYEAKGLIQPHRTSGGTRRYSADDITDVRRITALLEEGLNLAGVEAVLALEEENRQLRAEVDRLRAAPGTKGQGDEGRGKNEKRVGDHDRQDVRPDVADHDAPTGQAQRPRRLAGGAAG